MKQIENDFNMEKAYNNFKNKKTSLNTKIDLNQEPPAFPFHVMEPQRIPVLNEKLKNENMSDKKMYICIVDDCESKVGSILEIEEWLDEDGFEEEDNYIVMYELKSDVPVSCSFKRKTSIKLN